MKTVSKSKIYFQGQEIGSMDELPPEVRQKLDTDNNGQMDILEQMGPDLQAKLDQLKQGKSIEFGILGWFFPILPLLAKLFESSLKMSEVRETQVSIDDQTAIESSIQSQSDDFSNPTAHSLPDTDPFPVEVRSKQQKQVQVIAALIGLYFLYSLAPDFWHQLWGWLWSTRLF